MNIVKTTLFSALLLAVFSLPTLTATQLVGVLGESTKSENLFRKVLGDKFTFVKSVPGSLTVSYTTAGLHPVLRLTNPNPVSRVFRVGVPVARDGALLSQTVDLQASGKNYRLYDRSVQPFNPSYNLEIPAGQTVDLSLFVSTSGQSYGTVELAAGEF